MQYATSSHSPPRLWKRLLYIIFLLIVSICHSTHKDALSKRRLDGSAHFRSSMSPISRSCITSSTLGLKIIVRATQGYVKDSSESNRTISLEMETASGTGVMAIGVGNTPVMRWRPLECDATSTPSMVRVMNCFLPCSGFRVVTTRVALADRTRTLRLRIRRNRLVTRIQNHSLHTQLIHTRNEQYFITV